MLFAWGQDEREGEIILLNDYKGTRQIIEQIRFGYAFNKNVTISHNQTSAQANNITLGDGVIYQKLLIHFNRSLPITINPRSCELPEGFNFFGNTDALRTGFCFETQTNRRTHYAVELESKTANNEFANLKKYLLCESKEAWSAHIDILLATGGHSLNNLFALPDVALKELSNQQRISLIEKIATSQVRDFYPLVNRVVANVRMEDIESFILMLDEGTRIMDLCGMLSRAPFNSNDYDDFIMELFKLYYRQQPADALLSLTSIKDICTWHQSKDFNVLYNVSFVGDGQISLSAVLDHLTENGNRRETIFDYHPKTNLRPMAIVGVNFTTIIDFLGIEGMVLPMPAIFFKWIVDKQREDEIKDMIKLGFNLTSFCVAYGEARASLKAGHEGLKLAMRLAGFIHASGDMFMGFNDDVVNTLNNSRNGERFLVAWNTAGFLLNGQNAFEKIKDRDLPLFIVMKFSWDGLTALEKSLFNESELARIEELLEVINSTLNY